MSNKVEVQTRNIRWPAGETETINPPDFLRNLHNEQPFLRPISIAMIDHDSDLFWHQAVVSMGYRALLNCLSANLNGNHVALARRTGPAMGHDIGKYGVAGDFETGVAGTISESLAIINYVQEGFVRGQSQLNTRPDYVIARSHLHTLLGNLIIREIFKEFNQKVSLSERIPKHVTEEYSRVALNHHRNDNSDHRKSYPGRTRLKGKNKIQVASEFMIELMDIPIAMLADDRLYRFALERDLANQEVEKYLQNDKILKFILPVFAGVKNVGELKVLLYEKVQLALDQIKDFVNAKPPTQELKALVGGQPEPVDLQMIINNVWKRYHVQLGNAYKNNLKNGFFHNTR
jgi:hypothetical protein